MREILFRGKRVGSEEWVEGFYLTSPEFDNQEIAVITTDRPRNPYYVSKETVGQYTGLTDKNGTKIFEGDIVKGAWNTILVIYYDDCYTQFRAKHKWGENEISYYGDTNKLEVIGNIHDNPELLKGGE